MSQITPIPGLKLKVLVADDDAVARRVVVGTLRGRFEIYEAADGAQALEAFVAHEPDLVLLDVDMPIKNGVEVAEQMRSLAGDRYVPILLVSGMDEVSTLVEGLSRGADDFLPKPFNRRVFDSKLAVILRIRDMQERLRDQMRELEQFRQTTQEEHALAQEVFGRILARGSQGRGLRVSASPLAMFNGDVVLTSATPAGGFRWMLADVAGHGLSGAIGTVPLSSLFHRSTNHGYTLREVLIAMNEELRAMLPSRLFCAAVALELDPSRKRLTVCNAGMPDVQVLQAGQLRHVGSKNLPLAILDHMDPQFDVLEVEPGDRVFTVSDGIIECQDSQGQMFGVERLCELLTTGTPETAFDRLLAAVSAFSGGLQSDDVSVTEVTL